MRIIIEKDYDAMSKLAAAVLLGHMMRDGRVNISITAGRSPKLMYEKYINPELKGKEWFSNVHFYSFDETPIYTPDGKKVSGDNSSALIDCFFTPAQILNHQIHLMNEENYANYDQMIDEVGGLDMMLIGLGDDGHFCANMPECTKFNQYSYKVKLTNQYPWNEPYQKSLHGNYSDYMFSMGPRSVMKVRHLVLIVNGKAKAEIVRAALEGEVREDIPASVLQLHPNLTVILDQDAASKLTTV